MQTARRTAQMPRASDQIATRFQGEPAQAEVIAFLSDSATYGSSERVQCITTHASRIFLAGDLAYKIKRAVKYPYLDYSTLDQRRRMCEREFAINKPNAPDLYLDVVSVTRQGGLLRLDGPGEPVEWALRMRRFPAGALLSEHLRHAGRVDDSLLDDVATVIAEFHAGAPSEVARQGSTSIAAIIDELAVGLAASPRTFPADDVDTFVDQCRVWLDRSHRALDIRARLGRIRRCHGDLHLSNIVLIDGRPVLFDAIEFDDAISTIDVLYDLAFLLMDLDANGFGMDANRLLNRYLQTSRSDADLLGLAAMPLFLALRAAVRAMVAAQRAGDAANSANTGEARRYFDKAQSYLLPRRPLLVAIGGLSGTGKTTLGRALAPRFGAAPGALHLRSDIERKRMADVAETVRLGPEHYTEANSAAVYARLRKMARRALRSNFPVIVDAVFLEPSERSAMAAVAQSTGVPFIGLWLTTSKETAQRRVAERRYDASDATSSIVAQQAARPSGPIDWLVVVADGPRDATIAAAEAHLRSMMPRASRS